MVTGTLCDKRRGTGSTTGHCQLVHRPSDGGRVTHTYPVLISSSSYTLLGHHTEDHDGEVEGPGVKEVDPGGMQRRSSDPREFCD